MALPVLLSLSLAVFGGFKQYETIQAAQGDFETLLRLVYLHFIVFFIAGVFGFAVMRQETDDQTLHYLLMQPVARPVILLGKFLAFIFISTITCAASLWITYFIWMVPQFGLSEVTANLFSGHRLGILAKESSVICLTLVAYGSFALLMGTLFKSAFYALLLIGWGWALPYLPSNLKFWTVLYHAQSLLPDKQLPEQPLFELLGAPVAASTSILFLLGASALFLILAGFFFQVRECLYSES